MVEPPVSTILAQSWSLFLHAPGIIVPFSWSVSSTVDSYIYHVLLVRLALWAGCQSKYLEVAVFHDNYKCFAIFPLESLWKMDEQGFLWDFIDNYQPPFPHLRYSWTTSEQEATDLTFLQWLQVRRAFGYNHGKISSKSWKITKKKLW